MKNDPGQWTVCRHSRKPKPPRAHFDKVTGKLVMNMDHYCPWMFNCVGFSNYRYFVLFLKFLVERFAGPAAARGGGARPSKPPGPASGPASPLATRQSPRARRQTVSYVPGQGGGLAKKKAA